MESILMPFTRQPPPIENNTMHPSDHRIVWTNTHFPNDVDLQLKEAVSPFPLQYASHRSASNLVGTPHDPSLDEAEIAFGQPDSNQLLQSKKLKWVHLTSAGYTNYDRQDLKDSFRERGIALTTSSGVYDEPCAQHVLSMILAMSRQLPTCFNDQSGQRSWPAATVRANSFLLQGQKVIIYGFGEIALRLCEMLAPFGMIIVGVRRKPRGDEPIPIVNIEQSDDWLLEADHVLNILPANDDSTNFFDRERLSLLKPSALFYNIGRGTTVDQSALCDLLNSERIAGAYLDVTRPEPLPANDPLWTARNSFITPHSAGGFDYEMNALVEHFAENLRRYSAGEELLNRVI